MERSSIFLKSLKILVIIIIFQNLSDPGLNVLTLQTQIAFSDQSVFVKEWTHYVITQYAAYLDTQYAIP